MQPLVIRVDADSKIGIGHVMRCMALAQEWQELGGRVAFLMAPGGENLHPRLRAQGFEVSLLAATCASIEDAREAAGLCRGMDAEWIVVDGYQFDGAYQRALKDASFSVFFFDDCGDARYYSADIVLNQNLQASEELYNNREPKTRLLLGPRYALMRREFRDRLPFNRDFPDTAGKVLVTLGGADFENVTLKVVQALRALPIPVQTKVLVGPMNANYRVLEERVAPSIELIRSTDDLAGLMLWADIAVSAAGATSLESCFMGLPSLLLVLAENQSKGADRLHAYGAALNLGHHSTVATQMISNSISELLRSKKQRVQLSCRGRELVDGAGASRVLGAMQCLAIDLRRVTQSDCKMLWEWANDIAVRTESFSSAPIGWSQHLDWFTRKTNDSSCFMFIGLNSNGVPVGQVRFDLDADLAATVGVTVAPVHRGIGYGTPLISRAVKELFSVSDARKVHAYIKPGNKASIKAFEQAGFHWVEMTKVRGTEALHYVQEALNHPVH